MEQASPFKPIALVVEDDAFQRGLVAVLLEESGMGGVQCESAEAAWRVLEKIGGCVSIMFTDVNLAGKTDGGELARFARQRYRNIQVIVTSGHAMTKSLPVRAS